MTNLSRIVVLVLIAAVSIACAPTGWECVVTEAGMREREIEGLGSRASAESTETVTIGQTYYSSSGCVGKDESLGLKR